MSYYNPGPETLLRPFQRGVGGIRKQGVQDTDMLIMIPGIDP